MITKKNIYPLFNISIKGLTLLGKFGLIFYMAKHLLPSDVGTYGLLTVLIFYSLYAVGLDFYTYSTRELVKLDKSEWWKYIKSQLFLILTSYFLFLPIVLVITYNILGIDWIPFFIVLLILEHVNQEISRLLIIFHKNIWANNLNFIRQGLWCFILVLLVETNISELTLEFIFILWSVFNLLALTIGSCLLKKQIIFNKSCIDFLWLKKGLKVSFLFLMATLCIRAISTIDRIWLEHIDGLTLVGAYSLYVGLTNSLIGFLDSGVFSFIYPKMIKDVHNQTLFLSHVKKLASHTFIFTILISISLLIITPFLLNWIGKEIYKNYIDMFYIVLIANIIYCLSMIFHYILYSHNKDKQIFFSHLMAMITFFIATSSLILLDINNSVAYGVLMSFLGLFLVKLYYASIILKKEDNNELSYSC
ncbi:hypothetical protein BKK52_12570 [Rodentibacter trehalosifermentans]|uniref:Polysaccharide biosynthesis protein n=1 Tax=Rodentibacter trehalosifermentans TaxID=1908263 RepID=A0A1V3ITB1_9PAST|nr:hypothetical protein [Rodentibacter trehalosifermentans]OOF45502.1 hypothetical protein BKK52_12570 [Rodentibacter trehalosifermentans]